MVYTATLTLLRANNHGLGLVPAKMISQSDAVLGSALCSFRKPPDRRAQLQSIEGFVSRVNIFSFYSLYAAFMVSRLLPLADLSGLIRGCSGVGLSAMTIMRTCFMELIGFGRK